MCQDRECNCGSGKPRYELRDAAGMFCAFVCEVCEEKKKSTFNPRIFRDYYDPDKSDVEYADDY
jgi:hypothetical protein